MNQESENETESEVPTSEGPGNRLREAREAAGLNLAQVAERLLLNREVIDKLEEDAYDELPPAAYVRGYIRSYAQMVKLDPEPLIEQFNQLGIGEPEPEVTEGKPDSADDTSMVWSTVVIVGVLLGLVATWWYNKNYRQLDVQQAIGQTSELHQDEPPSVEAEVEVLSEVPADEQAIEQGLAPVRSPQQDEGQQEPETETVTEQQTRTPQTVGKPTAVQQQETPDNTIATLQQPVIEELAEMDINVRLEDIQTEGRHAAGDDILYLTFNEVSWVEVHDANNELLLYGLLQAGLDRSLKGTAPFEILLGYSPGVDISINGTRFDQSRHNRRDNTARFLVQTESDNQQ